MEKWKVEQILQATGGRLFHGDAQTGIEEVVRDSGDAKPGTVFFALIGETKDGHVYGQKAAENGASALVFHDEQVANQVRNAMPNTTIVLVEDTTKALQDFAKWHLNRWPIKTIGVTGSVGKTTTKEMLYAMVSQKYKTVKTDGNFNNHIGLPLTIFRITESTEVVILEMGMSSLGEIHRLADIVRPDIAIITNVGTSHMEHLKTRENILRAKMEITDFLTEKDVLIVNSDNDKLAGESLCSCIKEKKQGVSSYDGRFSILTTGEKEPVDFLLSNGKNLGTEGSSFTITHDGRSQSFSVPILGDHNGGNGALAVAAATWLGVSMEQAAQGLRGMEQDAKRRLHLEAVGGVTLLDDTYNASPESCMAAIDTLMSLPGKRKIAVLADMLEMGTETEGYHGALGAYVAEKKVDVLIAIGQHAKFIAEGAEQAGTHTAVLYHETKEPFLHHMADLLQEGDVVLVKGSNGMKMTEVTDKIRSL